MNQNTKSVAYWEKLVTPYKDNPISKSLFQLVSTLICFFLLCYAMYLFEPNYYFISLLLAIPTSLFVVKIFIIQHDCGHGSFYKNKTLNNITGRLLTAITATPYDQWKKEHNRHHATSGNLNHRGVGDITTLTIEEYNKRGKWAKLRYKIYRNPAFLFTIGATLQFMVMHRFPIYKAGRISSWVSAISTTLYMGLMIAGFSYLIGFTAFLKIYLPLMLMACAIGTWFFYIQHQYEDTYWQENHSWNYCDAALHGSSFYDVPKWLQWMTGHISYHHIHHLSAKIPNYNLRKCYEETPELQSSSRISLIESFKCAKLALWDNINKKMVTFKDAKSLAY